MKYVVLALAFLLLSPTSFANGNTPQDPRQHQGQGQDQAQKKHQGQGQDQAQQQMLNNKINNEFKGEQNVTTFNKVGVKNDVDMEVKVDGSKSNSELVIEEGAIVAKGGAGGTIESGAVQTDADATAEATGIDGDLNVSPEINISSHYAARQVAAGVDNPDTQHVQLYDLTALAAEAGIPFSLFYEELCPIRSSGTLLETVEWKKDGVMTYMTPHQNFLLKKKRNKDVAGVVVPGPFSEPTRVDCLGELTVASIDKKKNLPYSVIRERAIEFAHRRLGHFGTIRLITTQDVIAAARGVKSNGSGWNLLPGASKLFTGSDIFGTLGGGVTQNNGYSSPNVQVGTTYLVFFENKDGSLNLKNEVFDPEPETPDEDAELTQCDPCTTVVPEEPAKTVEVIKEKIVSYQPRHRNPPITQ